MKGPVHGTRLSRFLLTAAGIGALIFLVLPILIVVPMSFSSTRFLAFPPPSLSTRWYAEFFSSTEWMLASVVSLKVAFATCLIATPVGVAAAYVIHMQTGRLARAAYVILVTPLMVPHIIVAIGVFFLYARIGADNSIVGLILAHTMLAIPFVLITTLSGLQSFDMTQERAAQSLGVSRLQAFLKVTAPARMRMIALAETIEGADRVTAARRADMSDQAVVDAIKRYNAEGIDGLYDRPRSGRPPKRDDEQRAALRQIVIDGPDVEAEGLSSCTRDDLVKIAKDKWGVELAVTSMGRNLREIGLSRQKARPSNPKKNVEAAEALKMGSRRAY